MARFPAVVIMVVVVMVAACSSTDAGSRYLEIVNPVNCALERIQAIERGASLGDGSFDPMALGSVQAGFAELASLRRTAVRELLNEKWPGSVSGEMDAMAEMWALVAERERNLADAYDLGAYNLLAVQHMNSPLEGANPGLIRAQLDLGSAEETNRC